VGAVLAGVITTLVASVLPALRAAQEEPADAVRRVPPSQRWPLRLGQLAGSLLLAGIGVALVAFKDHLPPRVGSFAGVGFLFLGSFLAMALMSALVARVFQPLTQNLFSVEDRLAADNLIRSPGRTGRVIAALAACVALLIQTAGVIRSHEKAILSWLEHSVTADLIVTAGGPISSSGQNVPMKADLAHKIEEVLPGSKAVAISFRYVDWPYREGETLILIMAVDTGLYYQRNRQRGANVPQLDLYWRLSQEPGTAVVSQNFSQLHRLKEGDSFTIPGYEGPVPLQVIGVIEDYTWNRGSVLVHRDHISRAFQTNLVDAFDVFLSAPEETETARKTLQNSSLAADHSLFVLTEEGLRTHVSNLIHRLYGLAYSQEVVVGLVAALGEVTALLISVLQRRRELGLLRAVGATQVQVLRSVLAEAFLMGIIGGLLGVAFGLVLEWYAVRVILLEEGGFSFPISLPWLEVLVFVGLALVLALSAGLLPALQAVRLRLADALAYE
jgi:putative ABC transport system permease protein